ncbi:MAG: class I SAM-dependent methyltransferase [Bacillota bacterium]|nr:class I SAM-dependent methyltransferase [Bacillota bacterium]
MKTERKYHIEKGTVQETLIVPLYGRKMCAEKYPALFDDRSAKILCEKLDYDFSEQEAKKDTFAFEFGSLEVAMRQLDMMWEIREYLQLYPEATVVNLGCGLDQTGRACDNGRCRIINIDLPDAIELRNRLLPPGDREKNVVCDLKDHAWMDEIDGSKGVIFFAAGVFYYFKTEDVKTMVCRMAERFPGGRLVFDAVGKFGLKLMLSKTLKNMGIEGVDGFFSVNRYRKQLNWSDRIEVKSRGYMLGYHNMRSPGIKRSHRLLARIGDRCMKMAIIRMDFQSNTAE